MTKRRVSLVSKLNLQAIDIRILAVIASLLTSCFTYAFPKPLNDDAFLYIRTAEIFVDLGLAAAFSHYSWASYSVLIGLISLSGLSILQAAFLLNGLFYALLTYGFISVVKSIDDSDKTLVAAAILILVFPELNEYRHSLIRDIGFWAFVFIGVWQLNLFTHCHKVIHAAAFFVFLFLAAFLRIEAIAYLIFVPLVLLFFDRQKSEVRPLVFLALGSALSIVIVVLLLQLIGFDVFAMATVFVSRYAPFLQSAFSPEQGETLEVATAIFGSYGEVYSNYYVALFLASGFFGLLLVSVANALGLPLLLVLVIGLSKQLGKLRDKNPKVLLAFILVNFLIVFGFIYITRFLPSRYSMVLAISIAGLIPILVAQWLVQNHPLKGWQKSVPILIVVYLFIDSYISFGRSTDYINNAVDWLETEQIQPGQLVTNESAIAYFSGLVEDYDRVSNDIFISKVQRSNPGDIIALEFRPSLSSLVENQLDTDRYEQLANFPESSTPKIVMYRRVQ